MAASDLDAVPWARGPADAWPRTCGAVLAYAGHRIDDPDTDVIQRHFPESRSPWVVKQVDRVLRATEPSAVVGSAAAGSDLLVVERAHLAQIPVSLVLPLPEAAFESKSVAPHGVRWCSAFHHAL